VDAVCLVGVSVENGVVLLGGEDGFDTDVSEGDIEQVLRGAAILTDGTVQIEHECFDPVVCRHTPFSSRPGQINCGQ
jgi:hypothetical protein